MITLTLKHNSFAFRTQVDRLTDAFRQLRRLNIWTKTVRAAVWILEVQVSKTGRWHPHLHILVDAKFMEQAQLATAWLACTGDSSIVDIRAISASAATKYVLKYVTKPIPNAVLKSAAHLLEYVKTIKGKRTFAALGEWRKALSKHGQTDEKPSHDAEDLEPGVWLYIGYLEDFEERARDGDVFATETLDLATNHRRDYS